MRLHPHHQCGCALTAAPSPLLPPLAIRQHATPMQQPQLVLRRQRCCRPAVGAQRRQPHQQQPIQAAAPAPAPASPPAQAPPAESCWLSRLNWELLLLAAAATPPPHAAWAAAAAAVEEGLAYDASRGEGIVKTLSGTAYIGLLLYFLFKVLNRRARKAREERLAGQGPVRTVFTQLIEKMTADKPQPQATPAAAAFGALQAGLIAFGLFTFATKVEGVVNGQDLPEAYTARNIAITVRTILVGLTYLATFTFGANALGLAGLSVQLLLFPDSLPDDVPVSRTPKEPQLPKVTVTSSPDDIRKAFQAVAKTSSSSSSSSPSSSLGSSSSSGSSSPAATAAGSSSEEQ